MPNSTLVIDNSYEALILEYLIECLGSFFYKHFVVAMKNMATTKCL